MTGSDAFRDVMQLRHHPLFHQPFGQLYSPEAEGTGRAWSPLVDIFEDSEGITLKVDLPEVEAKNMQLLLEGNALTLRGERELEHADKQEGYHRIERFHGTFSRSFTLPPTIEMDRVTANSRDGVLRIFLPKKAETKPRQIKVETTVSTAAVAPKQ